MITVKYTHVFKDESTLKEKIEDLLSDSAENIDDELYDEWVEDEMEGSISGSYTVDYNDFAFLKRKSFELAKNHGYDLTDEKDKDYWDESFRCKVDFSISLENENIELNLSSVRMYHYEENFEADVDIENTYLKELCCIIKELTEIATLQSIETFYEK